MVTNVPQGATAWALGFGAISGSDFGVWAEGKDTQMEENLHILSSCELRYSASFRALNAARFPPAHDSWFLKPNPKP